LKLFLAAANVMQISSGKQTHWLLDIVYFGRTSSSNTQIFSDLDAVELRRAASPT